MLNPLTRSSEGAQLLGREAGRGADITLAPHRGGFINKVEVKAGRWAAGWGEGGTHGGCCCLKRGARSRLMPAARGGSPGGC